MGGRAGPTWAGVVGAAAKPAPKWGKLVPQPLWGSSARGEMLAVLRGGGCLKPVQGAPVLVCVLCHEGQFKGLPGVLSVSERVCQLPSDSFDIRGVTKPKLGAGFVGEGNSCCLAGGDVFLLFGNPVCQL